MKWVWGGFRSPDGALRAFTPVFDGLSVIRDRRSRIPLALRAGYGPSATSRYALALAHKSPRSAFFQSGMAEMIFCRSRMSACSRR